MFMACTWVALIEGRGHLDSDTCLCGYYFLTQGVLCVIPEIFPRWTLDGPQREKGMSRLTHWTD